MHGIAPQEKEIAAKSVKWGKLAAANEQPAWFVHTLALAQVRAGESDEAIQTLRQQVTTATWSPFLNQIALAVAYRLAGEKKQSQIWIKLARQWQADQRNAAVEGTVNVQVIDWLPFHVLLREAERQSQ